MQRYYGLTPASGFVSMTSSILALQKKHSFLLIIWCWMQALYRQQTQTLKPTAINIQPVSTVVSTHTSSKSVKFETIGHWERTMSSTGTTQKWSIEKHSEKPDA